MTPRNVSRNSPEKSGGNEKASAADPKTRAVNNERLIRQTRPRVVKYVKNLAFYGFPREEAHAAIDEGYDEAESK